MKLVKLLGSIVAISFFGLSAQAEIGPDDVTRGLYRLNVCDIQASVLNAGVEVESLRLVKGGMPNRFGQGQEKCQTLIEKKLTRLCKRNNRKNKVADSYQVIFGYRLGQADDTIPSPPCTGPEDINCFDPLVQNFSLPLVDAGFVSGACSDLLPELLPESAGEEDASVIETDIETIDSSNVQ